MAHEYMQGGLLEFSGGAAGRLCICTWGAIAEREVERINEESQRAPEYARVAVFLFFFWFCCFFFLYWNGVESGGWGIGTWGFGNLLGLAFLSAVFFRVRFRLWLR